MAAQQKSGATAMNSDHRGLLEYVANVIDEELHDLDPLRRRGRVRLHAMLKRCAQIKQHGLQRASGTASNGAGAERLGSPTTTRGSIASRGKSTSATRAASPGATPTTKEPLQWEHRNSGEIGKERRPPPA
jgi:hypothetical protein